MKKILCLDFDGVLHSYASGWKGPRTIPDPPVPGALEFLVAAQDRFEVHIFSSRSRYWFGRRAMRRWIEQHLVWLGTSAAPPAWWLNKVCESSFAEPWEDEVRWAARSFVRTLKFPTEKPPAHVTLDDRAMTFCGFWPTMESIEGFKPWNKR